MQVFASEGQPQRDRAYYEKKGEIIWEVVTPHKLIALTFDDGPHPAQTVEILNLLKQYNVPATFFVIGKQVAENPDVVKRIVAEGHELANHTYSHTFFRLPASSDKVLSEIAKTEEEIYKLTGHRSKYFRPPGGIYDDTIVQVSKQLGLCPVLWSWDQDTRDWSKPGVQRIINKVLKNADNGDIVLFHDRVAGRSQTIQALKTIIPSLQAQGYQMVTVTDLIKFSKSSRF
ncbi:polysaccharide deacetylase [Paenibacillus sp. CAA11]|uniref:polysaccharide deacetylase family protein n=1 Tax=Paenibacillus sp. CAA11 TaxID=1532905 RepID=UPI000D331B97|nr:polysaccharide deacetylase family protein [Paenibacillus sp. CAA11]AWB47038.1 polysaccharide deacetylase [Paenibacillus sp. CAA11]